MAEPDPERRRIEQELRRLRAPAERDAAERALAVARAALAERDVETPPRSRRALRPALAALLAAAGLALVLSPAGASVREWMERVVGSDSERLAPPRLPTAGSILTRNDQSIWIARADGSRRLLGGYAEATFSPRGLNVAVARGRDLAAISAAGELRWSLTAPARVGTPAWAPSGVRIAYRAGSALRLVEGDGSDDTRLARGVVPVAPAWRPAIDGEPARDVLAWARRDGRVRVADVVDATGEPVTIEPRGKPTRLAWLADGRLAIATAETEAHGVAEVAIYSLPGEFQGAFPQPPGARVTGLAASPLGARLAVSRRIADTDGVRRSELSLIRAEPGAERQRQLFSAPGELAGVAFAPDGRWVAFGWPAADSWLFVRPRQQSKLLEELEALPRISERFDGNGPSERPDGFPTVLEWCC